MRAQNRYQSGTDENLVMEKTNARLHCGDVVYHHCIYMLANRFRNVWKRKLENVDKVYNSFTANAPLLRFSFSLARSAPSPPAALFSLLRAQAVCVFRIEYANGKKCVLHLCVLGTAAIDEQYEIEIGWEILYMALFWCVVSLYAAYKRQDIIDFNVFSCDIPSPIFRIGPFLLHLFGTMRLLE